MHRVIGSICQTNEGKRGCCSLLRIGHMSGGKEAYVPPGRQVFVQGRLLWHIAETRSHLMAVRHRIEAEHRNSAGLRLQGTNKGADQRCLAGAVRSDQPEDLTGCNLELDTSQRID
jgi:hypothetical protein